LNCCSAAPTRGVLFLSGVKTKTTDGPESPLARFNNERDEHQAAIEAMVGAIADAQVN